ncbi:hypothetical protein QD336_17410 [Rhizobium sp. BR 250]
MKNISATDARRLNFISHYEESEGELPVSEAGSASWEKCEEALTICAETFAMKVLRSPAILNDPQLFSAAEQAYEAICRLDGLMMDKLLGDEA